MVIIINNRYVSQVKINNHHFKIVTDKKTVRQRLNRRLFIWSHTSHTLNVCYTGIVFYQILYSLTWKKVMIIYWKYLFIVGCRKGFYGSGCSYHCPSVCKDMCNPDNGKCLDDVSVIDRKCLILVSYLWCWYCTMLFTFSLRVLV